MRRRFYLFSVGSLCESELKVVFFHVKKKKKLLQNSLMESNM